MILAARWLFRWQRARKDARMSRFEAHARALASLALSIRDRFDARWRYRFDNSEERLGRNGARPISGGVFCRSKREMSPYDLLWLPENHHWWQLRDRAEMRKSSLQAALIAARPDQ